MPALKRTTSKVSRIIIKRDRHSLAIVIEGGIALGAIGIVAVAYIIHLFL